MKRNFRRSPDKRTPETTKVELNSFLKLTESNALILQLRKLRDWDFPVPHGHLGRAGART